MGRFDALAVILGILAGSHNQEEVRAPREPEFGDFRVRPAKYTNSSTHPRSPKRHKPKRKKK